jgi:hypothetical protein
MKVFLASFSALALFLLAATSPVQAASLAPLATGATVSPVPVTTGEPQGTLQPGGTFTGTATGTAAGGKTINVSYTESVFKNGTGVEMVYQFTNNGTAAITSVVFSNFAGFTTSVGQNSSGSGQVKSTAASRSSTGFDNGNTVSFAFGAGLGAGKTSFKLFVQTNAPNFNSSGGATFNALGGSGGGGGLSASLHIPEPGSLLLLAGSVFGLGGLGLWRRRMS